MAKKQTTDLAAPGKDANLATQGVQDMFGGSDSQIPIDVALPEIKLTKTSDFKMPDGTKATELIGNIVFVKRSRAWWEADFDGNTNPPDCASDDCIRPNDGQPKVQSGQCGEKLCLKATWDKLPDGRNIMACGQNLNMIFLPEGKAVPRFLRIRSTSMGRKSPLAAFFTDAIEPSFALGGKYQTVIVKLWLDETKINGFETSILQVMKISTLEAGDPLLPALGKMYATALAEFVVVHRSDSAPDVDGPPVDTGKVDTMSDLPPELRDDEAI